MTHINKLNDYQQNQSWNKVEHSGVIEIISHFNLAIVLTNLYQIGFIDKLYQIGEEPFGIDSFPELDPYLLSHLLKYLEIHGILIYCDGKYSITQKGVSLLSPPSIAQLCFYSEAYQSTVLNIGNLLRKDIIYGVDLMRDGKSLGKHCDTLFKEYHTPTMFEVVKHLKCKKILDVGCGGGQFLIDISQKDLNLKGIGMDISKPAIEYAKQVAAQKKLSERIDFVVADAFNLDSWSENCFDADILCGSGVVHEHFRDGEEAVINILNTYADLIENRNFKAIVLGEPEIRYDLVKSDIDLYLIHIFTAQGFPRKREDWLELFDKTRLKCDEVFTRPSAGPRFNFYLLTLKP